MSDRTGQRRGWPRRAFRLGLLVVVGVVAVVALALYLSVPTMGSGPAGPPVDRSAFSSPWTNRPVLLLGLGDSITDGYGASPGLSYFDRLVRNPDGEFPDMEGICLGAVLPGLAFHNGAVSGSTSIDCIERQIPRLSPADPDTFGIVVMTTGGNDIIHMYGRTPPEEGAMYGATLGQAKPWIENYEDRLGLIIARIEALFPGGCAIFLGNIYDPTDGTGNASLAGYPDWEDGLAIHATYNAIIARCADTHASVHLIDIYNTFMGHGLVCRQPWREHYHADDPHCWYYFNVEDPNDRGYDALRRLFLNAIVDWRKTAGPEWQ